MSSSDPQLREYQRLLQGHIQNLQAELSNLVSKVCLARAQNSNEFTTQAERTRQAIAQVQNFFGRNQSQFLVKIDSLVTKLENNPSDYSAIRALIDVEPEVLRLAGGPNEGVILEERIKKLVTDDQLKQELAELDATLRSFIEEQVDNVSYKNLAEIQKLAELIRQSQNRSILEIICKTDTLYVVAAGLADTFGGGHGAFTATTRLATLAQRVYKTAKKKVQDEMLDYIDGLELEKSDLRMKLAEKGGILSLEDAVEKAQTEYSGPDFPA